ncbi:MAG: helix-turn-helix domain-containing protein [Acidimicrobiia bacterium]
MTEAVGVSRKTVNTVENGVFVPSTTLALQLADFFGCKVEDLFALRGRGAGVNRRTDVIH